MSIQIDFWHLLGLLTSFIGTLCTFGLILLKQIDKHVDSQHLRLGLLEKELAEHKTRLPLDYQRREDAIRFESILHTKLDAISARIERLMEKEK